MNNYIFTFIIGYRHTTENLVNLRRNLNWVSGFNGIEIIIVEQDKNQKLPLFSLKGFKYIFTKSDLPFNKAWAYNVAIKSSSTNVLVFCDIEVICDPNDLVNMLVSIENYDAVTPNSIIKLTSAESNLPVNKTNFCDGMIIYKKGSLLKIGGWVEDFIGLGDELNILQSKKTESLLTTSRHNVKLYEYEHTVKQENEFFSKRNSEILKKLIVLNNTDMMKYNESSLSKIGIKNRFFDK